MSETFRKFDNNKPDMSLCPPLLMEMYARVSGMGAAKYGRNNWMNMEVKDACRIYSACLRHLNGYTDEEGHSRGFRNGEALDKESGLSNLDHALWQLVALKFLVNKFGYEEVMKHL